MLRFIYVKSTFTAQPKILEDLKNEGSEVKCELSNERKAQTLKLHAALMATEVFGSVWS